MNKIFIMLFLPAILMSGMLFAIKRISQLKGTEVNSWRRSIGSDGALVRNESVRFAKINTQLRGPVYATALTLMLLLSTLPPAQAQFFGDFRGGVNVDAYPWLNGRGFNFQQDTHVYGEVDAYGRSDKMQHEMYMRQEYDLRGRLRDYEIDYRAKIRQ